MGIYSLYLPPQCDLSGFCPCNSRGGEGFCKYSAAIAASTVGTVNSEKFVGNDYKGRADYLSKKFADPGNQSKLESYNAYTKVVKNGDSAEWYDLLNIKRGGGNLSSDNIYATFMSQ